MEGYKYLNSYVLATIICDLTYKFCNTYIPKSSRTHDQMIQAARSGKQNIAEGWIMQSRESYIRLLGVAQGSIHELAADYEDFLRQHHWGVWGKDDLRVREFRVFRAIWVTPNIPNTPNLPNNPESSANMLLTFCRMGSFLLTRQIRGLTDKFIKEGGFRENLFRKRREAIKNNHGKTPYF